MSQKTDTEIAADILIAALQSGQIKTFSNLSGESAKSVGEAFKTIHQAVVEAANSTY